MPRKDTPALRALQTAIDLCGGSRRELARRVCEIGYPGVRAGVNRPLFTTERIDKWFSRDGAVPIEVAPFVAAAVDGKVSVFDLCPHYEDGWRLIAQLFRAGQQEPEEEIA